MGKEELMRMDSTNRGFNGIKGKWNRWEWEGVGDKTLMKRVLEKGFNEGVGKSKWNGWNECNEREFWNEWESEMERLNWV